MFTGLVEDIGIVARADRSGDALVLAVEPRRIAVSELVVGESICHDGACLTVTAVDPTCYTVVAGAETLARTTLATATRGTHLNLERALRLGDRLGGHWVSGHIDGAGELVARRDLGSNLVLEFCAAAELMRYIVVKGSVALAGVSLTVNTADRERFSVAIIPHTLQQTTLGDLRVGDAVNLETDIVGKYVEKLLENRA